MTTNRKPAAWLALLLSCLMAIPSVAWAEDTELFTTSANPNVLLMLDITGSMNTAAGGTSVGDLDGGGNTNSRMDILWKVVYTLLNADLSTPSGTVMATGTLRGARYSSNNNWDTSSPIIVPGTNYNRIRVGSLTSSEWSILPDSGTVEIGSVGVTESLAYTSKGIDSNGRYYLSFASRTFVNTFNLDATVAYTNSVTYTQNYPTTNSEAVSADFLNNLTAADEETLKARLGLMTFTTNSDASSIRINIRNQIQSSDSNAPPFNQTYRSIWDNTTQYARYGGGTPTAQALREAQTFFSTATANNTVDICRPNFAVLVTDGEDTMGGLSGATGDGRGPDYYCGGSFNANGWNCGSNVGQVARHNSVILEAANLKNFSPSVKLFTVGVGITGTDADLRVQRDVLRRTAEQLDARANNSQYNTIGGLADNTSRGAGRAFFASDAAELTTALRNVFHQISAGLYSFTAPTVASVRMTDRNYLYKASFQPTAPPSTFWPGKLEALTINSDNTFTTHWDAGVVLQGTASSARRIYTAGNSAGTWGRRSFDDTFLTAAILGVDNDAVRDNVIAYVRGEGHDNNAKLGDIFHSKPVVVGPPSRFYFDEGYSTAVGSDNSFADAKATRKRVIFAGTNDGMLHAFLSGVYQSATGLFDSGTGEELFGYVPNTLLPNIREFLPGNLTVHGYFVDSSPRVADVWIDEDDDGTRESSEWKTVLIGGMRMGGNGYFALDVTDPPTDTDYSNYPRVLWEFTDPSHIGETWSEPVIGKVKIQKSGWTTARDRWVAIFGGGKSDDSAANSLIVLDIASGTALKTFTAGIDNNIVASPTMLFDPNGYIKFVYVADLDGSLYKFDLRSTGLESNSYADWGFVKLFQSSDDQPVYHRAEPGSITENLRYLYFGTGNQEFPVTDNGAGKFYAIKDTDTYFPASPLTEANLANLTGNLGTGTSVPTDNGWLIALDNIVSSSANAADTNSHLKEKVLSDPVVFFNNVFFTTFQPVTSSPCGGGGVARVYGINMINATPGLAALPEKGESSASGKVPYHVYSGNPEGGIPSSPSLSIYPSGQSSIFIGFSTGAVKEIKIESPSQMKNIKSWKETF